MRPYRKEGAQLGYLILQLLILHGGLLQALAVLAHLAQHLRLLTFHRAGMVCQISIMQLHLPCLQSRSVIKQGLKRNSMQKLLTDEHAQHD